MALNFVLSRSLARQCLLGRSGAMLAASVSRKNLMLTPVQQKRIYGPEEAHEKHDVTSHWKREHYGMIALLPLIPAALIYPHPVLDTVMVSAMALHVHWGLYGVAGDYVHGATAPKFAKGFVVLASIVAYSCLLYFNYFDVGFSNAVRALYSQL